MLGKSTLRVRLRAFLVAALVVLASAMLTVPAVAKSARGIKVEWQPVKPLTGAACLLKVTSPAKLQELHGKWLDHEILFDSTDGGRTWVALAGVSLTTKPGKYPLNLEGLPVPAVAQKARQRQSALPVVFSKKIPVAVLKRKVIQEKPLEVEKKFTAPDPEILKRVAQEKEYNSEAYAKTSPHALWSGPFARPLDSVITETFGVRRVFNGDLRSEHHGVDFRAAPGTSVLASNSGTVVLAREMFYEGNCVILDHGDGLFTIYMHFSKFAVKEGDRVERLQKLGESGATGRVTGPHLHVSVLWKGVPLDLLSLTELKLPEFH
jgi:murein DD-endopeptidase MepM/ murein hydrolase activator NlpD